MPRGVPRAKTPPPTPPIEEQPHDGGTQTDLARAAIEIFNPDFENLNLQQKIARITGMVGGVEKRGYNAFHKYHYVMEADLVAAVRQYLAAAGIVIIPNAHKWEFHGEICMVDVEYIVSDGNEAFTFSMPGAGADRGDKGVYKAITGSMKYALMKLFKIETGDDPESDTRVDERAHVADRPRSEVRVTGGERAGVRRGGHTEKASPVQIRRVSELTKDLELSRAELVERIFAITDKQIALPEEEDAQQKIILETLKEMQGDAIGELIVALAYEAVARSAAPEEPAYG